MAMAQRHNPGSELLPSTVESAFERGTSSDTPLFVVDDLSWFDDGLL